MLRSSWFNDSEVLDKLAINKILQEKDKKYIKNMIVDTPLLGEDQFLIKPNHPEDNFNTYYNRVLHAYETIVTHYLTNLDPINNALIIISHGFMI